MSDFPQILPWVLAHEGGFVDHPDDPGGATMKGVTQAVYSAFRQRHGLPVQSVRNITDDELEAIYRRQYWDVVRGDDLPPGLDYAVFDFAVNSGPRRAAQFLQRVLGVADDGIIGERTLDAAKAASQAQAIMMLCGHRLQWLQTLRHFKTFGRGWTRRVNEVRDGALRRHKGLVHGVEASPADEGAAKAGGPQRASTTLAETLTSKEGLAVLAAPVGGALATAATGDGPVQIAIAIVLVIAALVGAYYVIRRRA
jgi:lysozyme family protein